MGEYDQLIAEDFPPDVYHAVDVVRHPLYRNMMRYHENGFVESEPRYDIALLLLDREVKLAPNVAPICLPPTSDANDPNILASSSEESDYLGTVVGWGRLGRDDTSPHSHVLQAASVPILSDAQCYTETGLANFADQLCAGGTETDASACPGDSGGALQIQDAQSDRWTLLGIVSNGPSVCGLQPVVFHKVAHTRDWIENVVERQRAEPRVHAVP